MPVCSNLQGLLSWPAARDVLMVSWLQCRDLVVLDLSVGPSFLGSFVRALSVGTDAIPLRYALFDCFLGSFSLLHFPEFLLYRHWTSWINSLIL